MPASGPHRRPVRDRVPGPAGGKNSQTSIAVLSARARPLPSYSSDHSKRPGLRPAPRHAGVRVARAPAKKAYITRSDFSPCNPPSRRRLEPQAQGGHPVGGITVTLFSVTSVSLWPSPNRRSVDHLRFLMIGSFSRSHSRMYRWCRGPSSVSTRILLPPISIS